MDKQRAKEVMARWTLDTEYPPGADETRHLEVRRLAGTFLLLMTQAEDVGENESKCAPFRLAAAEVLAQLGAAVCYPSADFAEDITAARKAVRDLFFDCRATYHCNADGGYTRLLLECGRRRGEDWSVRLIKTGVSPRPKLTAFTSDDS